MAEIYERDPLEIAGDKTLLQELIEYLTKMRDNFQAIEASGKRVTNKAVRKGLDKETPSDTDPAPAA